MLVLSVGTGHGRVDGHIDKAVPDRHIRLRLPHFVALAGLTVPSYMQGKSLRPLLQGRTPADWQQVAYHRYWMHRDAIHNAYAHYSIRTQRYKLVYWYNEGYGLPGAHPGGEAPEWEFFDCERDPLELLNCHADPAYAEAVAELTRLLARKMAEIGDDPAPLPPSVRA